MTLTEYLHENPDSLACFEKPKALYIHLPFCVSRCRYCDFHSFKKSSIPSSLIDAYIRSIPKRIALWKERLGVENFSTIYIGGGTPSSLEPVLLAELIGEISRLNGADVKEWSIEANPESMTKSFLEVLEDSPVTRVSIGIQSMDEHELNLLGRPGTVDDNRRALEEAAKTRLEISVDLMTALPLEEGSRFDENLLLNAAEFCIEKGVNHISIYDLVVENGTVMEKSLKEGELLFPEEDQSFEIRQKTESMLTSKGFARYEISNYATKGHECAHNLAYWNLKSYLGVGSGAVSTLNLMNNIDSRRHSGKTIGDKGVFVGSLRIEGGKDIHAYLDSADDSSTIEEISRKDSAFEMLMMGFRTVKGPDCGEFIRRFGVDLHDVVGNTLDKWGPWLVRSSDGSVLALDFRGMDILNRFLVDCLVELGDYDF
jgi:oxygen-independent coproporphyrinogen-3 oxidase